MADLGELVVRVTVVADQAEAALAGIMDGLKALAAQGEQRIDLPLDIARVEQASAAVKGLAGNVKEIGQIAGDARAVEDWARGLADALVNVDAASLTEPLNALHERVIAGYMPTQEDLHGVEESMGLLTAVVVDALTAAGLQVDEQSTTVRGILAALGVPAEMLTGSFGELNAAVAGLGESFDWANASTAEAGKQAKALLARYDGLKASINRCKTESGLLEKGQAALNKAKKDGAKLSQSEQANLKAVSKLLGYQGNSYDLLQSLITQYGKRLGTELNTAQGKVMGLSAELTNAAACSNIDATVQADCSGAVSALQGLIAVARLALAVLSALGFAKSGGKGGGGGGGGGGGKKDDAQKEAQKAAQEAEEARKEAIQQDYELIAHKRHMNELTLESELAMLEKIRRKHQLTAEEIMEWEEKIYDLKQEIRERDAQSVDTLAHGVVDALSARYEAMRDAELGRLDASREAWEQWRDDSVKAIEEQIAALDKLADTEDREAKDAQELRKIEKLRRDVAYEQDEYNRVKLQQQLDAAIQAREERLRKLALDDQKDALRKEIDQINDKADEQLSALDKEQAGIEAAYE
ncbi:MAG: hypothetical protein RR521_10670, partial [Clostridia bacterium]